MFLFARLYIKRSIKLVSFESPMQIIKGLILNGMVLRKFRKVI